MTASTMHYSPGAPVLHSRDLVNWEFIGHSVPRLDFNDAYDLNGGNRYRGGIWASSLTHRPSENRFYWLGQIDFYRSFMYTATDPAGPWTRHAEFPRSYYDAGMLVDDDDTMYVAYGNTEISVAQLSADGKTEVRNQKVFDSPAETGGLEGSRFYKINGSYYIFLTKPPNGQYIFKSSSPWGPYEYREVLLDMPGPIPGGGIPHQGGLVSTPDGAWHYMSFVDAYPGGRVPALAPITWTSDGWPQVQTVDGAWGQTYPFPNLAPHPVPSMIGTDEFTAATLAAKWEWNHNPDDSKWTTGNGLRLQTATVTDDLYKARNTITHRIQGPSSTATVELDLASMMDGDRTGLAILRDSSAWIGVRRENGVLRAVMWDGLTHGPERRSTISTGTERARVPTCATPGSGCASPPTSDRAPNVRRTSPTARTGRTSSRSGPRTPSTPVWRSSWAPGSRSSTTPPKPSAEPSPSGASTSRRPDRFPTAASKEPERSTKTHLHVRGVQGFSGFSVPKNFGAPPHTWRCSEHDLVADARSARQRVRDRSAHRRPRVRVRLAPRPHLPLTIVHHEQQVGRSV